MTITPSHIAYMFYCLCAIALFATTIWVLRNGRKVKVTESIMLLLILGGLIYDNFMLGVGSLIFEESQGLLIATIPRFAIHALCTPLLIMHAALSCGRLNVPGYRSRTVITWWGATTFMCILLGLLREIDPVFEYSVEGGIAGIRGGRIKGRGVLRGPLRRIHMLVGGQHANRDRFKAVVIGATVAHAVPRLTGWQGDSDVV